jgi:hypothetical protein
LRYAGAGVHRRWLVVTGGEGGGRVGSVPSGAARCRVRVGPRASRLRTSGMPGRDLRLCPPGLGPGLACRVFISAEVRLDVGFNAAQTRLANLTCGGLLRRACDDAYHDLETGLARVGPLGAAPGLSRLVAIRFADMAVHADFAVVAVRWEATGQGGALFPALDADLTLTPGGDRDTMLTVSGAYRPPLGGLGAGLDRVLLHRVAQATIRAFAHQVAAAVAHPAASPEERRVRPRPESSLRPEPGMG